MIIIKNNNIIKTKKIFDLNGKKTLKRGPFGSALKKSFFVKSGFKVYEQKNAIRKNLNDGNYYIDIEKFNELKSFNVLPKDIIISCSGTVGEVYCIPENAPAGVINQALLRIRLSEKDYSLYYYYYFSSEKFKSKLLQDAMGGVIKNISGIEDLNNIEIIDIDYDEQVKIAHLLELQKNQVNNIKTLLEKIEIRNNYYADKLLSGELSIDEKGNIYNNKEIFRTLKLDEIFNFKMGQTILNKDITIEKHSEEEVPVFSATEKNKVFGYIHISKVKFPLNENDIIISARGTIGYPKINDIKIKTSTQTTIQMISKGTVSSYIVKKIMENKKEYYFASEGAAVPQLTISTLSNKTINIVENNLSVEVFLKKLDSEKSKVEKLLELEEKRFEWLSDTLLSGEYIIED